MSENENSTSKSIYKYCKFDLNAVCILINNSLYFNSIDNFNDPLDSRFNLNLINPQNFSFKTIEILDNQWIPFPFLLKKRFESLIDPNINTEHLKEVLYSYCQYLQRYIGIACFSFTKDDNTMWAHYADQAKGICIEFDKDLLKKSLSDNHNPGHKYYEFKVKYKGVNTRKVKFLKNGAFWDSLSHLGYKTLHWKYEKEFRIVLQFYGHPDPDMKYYEKLNPIVFFDPKCIKTIYYSKRMPETHKTLLINILQNKETIGLEEYEFNN